MITFADAGAVYAAHTAWTTVKMAIILAQNVVNSLARTRVKQTIEQSIFQSIFLLSA